MSIATISCVWSVGKNPATWKTAFEEEEEEEQDEQEQKQEQEQDKKVREKKKDNC